MRKDIILLHRALEIAKRSQDNGNLPFGCLLADEKGNILLEGENTVLTDNDSIAHCEINLIHEIAGSTNPAHIFDSSAKKLLSYGRRKIELLGPLLEQEAIELYKRWLK